MFVSTVTGRIEPHKLGVTLPHEHLIASFATPDESEAGWCRVGRTKPEAASDAAFYERTVSIETLGDLNLERQNRDNLTLDHELLATAELEEFARLGGGAVVEQSAVGLGRDPGALRRIAESTGLAVVMSAGWHHPAWSPELSDRSVDSLAAQITAEIEDGVDGIRAGVIGRIAAIDLARAGERALLEASARAAHRTGAPISLDRCAKPEGTLAALDLLAAHGVQPQQIAVGDCAALVAVPGELEQILDRGVFVQFDRLGRIPTILTAVSDHDIMERILELTAGGYAEQLLISQGVQRKIDLVAFGGNGYAFIARQYAPYMQAFGADGALIHALTHDNPQHWLTFAATEAAA